MHVQWENGDMESAVLSQQLAELDGLKAFRHRVLAGSLDEHRPEEHEINITLAGQIEVKKQGVTGNVITRRSDAGKICVTPSGQPMTAEWRDNLEILQMWIDPKFLQRIAVENEYSANFELIESFCEEDALLQHLGLTLLNQPHTDVTSDRLYADTLSQTFAIHVLRNYTSADTNPDQKGGLSGYKLRLVKEYINDNLDQDISLAELATVASLSRFHFTRSFRKSTGLTPRRYLMSRRVERAKLLLTSSNIPIVDVSLMTGFKNQSHFTNLFRRLTKFTPRNWREIGQT